MQNWNSDVYNAFLKQNRACFVYELLLSHLRRYSYQILEFALTKQIPSFLLANFDTDE